MRRLGTHQIDTSSSYPALCMLVYDGVSHLPVLALVQESLDAVPNVEINGIILPCISVLDEVSIKSSRPTSGGGLRRVTADVSFKTEHLQGFPFFNTSFPKEMYYGGKNYESIYFVFYSFDRSNQSEDIRLGACYGAFQIRDDLGWSEVDGTMTLSMVDILLTQEQIAGATDEPISDIFYIYNSWYQGNIFPKTYGQIPRIKALNAFPTFDLKKLASSISGQLYTTYGTGALTGAVLVLETNVAAGSLLLQLVTVGGTVRIKFANGEVMSGTLSHDTGTDEIKFTVTLRNTYYNQIKGWMDSKDGRTPSQWGANPNYTDVELSQNSTIIPDAKNVILDPNGWMQADIHFYDPVETNGDRLETNRATKMNGLLEERKDCVLHEWWPDPDYAGLVTGSTVSSFFDNTVSNSIYLTPNIVVLWGYDSFEFLNFYDEPQNIRLFFIDPATANVAGVIGDQWNLVGITPGSVDYSSYIRNGYSLFNSDHVYCEGEGRLIKIPSGNISSVTQSGTYYGLANLCKITFTTAPLDMNIGASSNKVYVDALYIQTNDTDSWLQSIVREIIEQECTGGIENLMAPQLADNTQYSALNIFPFVGVYITSNEKVTDIIDKLCYQCGAAMRWDAGLFDLVTTSRYFGTYELVVEVAPDRKYVKPLLVYTDKDEMLEKSAELTIGRLKTVLENGLEHIKLHFKATYGGWEDPFYDTIKSEINRTISPKARVIEYQYNYINDPDSFKQAVAMSLSIGSASAYSSCQRRISTEMTMNGCRWEALDGIVFKDYPLLSSAESNVLFHDVDGKIMYEKPIVLDEDDVDIVSPYFLMGCVGCVDEVSYIFNILKPVVKLTARMSQLNVDDVTGITYYNGPGAPKEPSVPTNPNSPPNQGGGSYGLGIGGYGGNNLLMPEIYTQPPEVIIDSTAVEQVEFELTCDSGWLYDLGWSWEAEVVDPKNTLGAVFTSSTTGAFANKTSDAYSPPNYYLTLNVSYIWFEKESLGTTSRELKIKFTRRYYLSFAGTGELQEDFFYVKIQVSRLPLAELEAE